MDNSIGDICRYQDELTRMMNIVDSLHKCFEDEKESMKRQVTEK